MTRIPDDRMGAWRAFLTAQAAVLDVLATELEEEQGLPLAWYEVLLYLYRSPDERLRMRRLADSLLVSRSAATRFIDRMEAAGLVRREPCEEDRRGTWVVLTHQGEQAFRRAAPVHLHGIERYFTSLLTDAEVGILTTALTRVAEAAPRRPAIPPE